VTGYVCATKSPNGQKYRSTKLWAKFDTCVKNEAPIFSNPPEEKSPNLNISNYIHIFARNVGEEMGVLPQDIATFCKKMNHSIVFF
jgi:hypothetical protein